MEASHFEPDGERSSYCGPAADSSLFETFRQVCQLYDLALPILILVYYEIESEARNSQIRTTSVYDVGCGNALAQCCGA